ncbi:MAG: hypothetical protein ACJ8GN_05905 [Longimicrobiaceae bacterium]
MRPRDLAAPANRGIVLDLVTFAVNLLLVRLLARELVGLVRRASAGDPAAEWVLGAFFLALFVLPAAGAVLLRWHFHARRGRRRDADDPAVFGCLLNPVFYFVVSVTVLMAAGVLFAQRIFGEGYEDRAEVFLPLMFGVMALGIVQTFLVYRYLDPPRNAPRGAFWRDGRSALLGDACIFLNMILFQVLWNVALAGRFARVTDFRDFAGRLFLLWFLSILVYFPPRIFYLAEDARRRASWLTMLLATSPAVLRVMGVI